MDPKKFSDKLVERPFSQKVFLKRATAVTAVPGLEKPPTLALWEKRI